MMTYPGGAKSEYQYDRSCESRKSWNKTREYEYSQGGNVLAKKTEHGDYGYNYDGLYRLIQENRPSPADDLQLLTDDYSYDAIGNRLTKTGVPGAWEYNANAELLSFGNTGFQYDPNGNLIRKIADDRQQVTDSYIYDVGDQLISVTRFTFDDSPFTVSYGYDPFGRRLWKQVDGKRVYYVYSDEGLIAEYDHRDSLTKIYGYRSTANEAAKGP